MWAPKTWHVLYLIVQCRVTPAFSPRVKLQFSKLPSHHKGTEGSKDHLPLYRFIILSLPCQNKINRTKHQGLGLLLIIWHPNSINSFPHFIPLFILLLWKSWKDNENWPDSGSPKSNKAGMDMDLYSATHLQNFSFSAIKAQSKLHFPDCQFLYAFFRAQM